MNINFDKTDRLIQIIEEAANSINFFHKWMGHIAEVKELANTGYYITKDGKKNHVNITVSNYRREKKYNPHHQEIILASWRKNSIYLP